MEKAEQMYNIITYFIQRTPNIKELFHYYFIIISQLTTEEVIKHKEKFLKECTWPGHYFVDSIMLMDHIIFQDQNQKI
jgi:hypothetical protein